MKNKQPQIGIFWIYKSTVIAKATPLNKAKPDSLSLFDSAYSHYIEWEEHKVYLPCFPELLAAEYQEIIRGRVIYSGDKKLFMIYADKKVVENIKYRKLVCDRFQLQCSNVSWRFDKHYRVFTT